MYFYKCLAKQLQDKKPFVVYRKPNASKMVGLFQKTFDLHQVRDFSEIGFVMAPFAQGQRFYIPLEQAVVLVDQAPVGDMGFEQNVLDYNDQHAKQAFESLVSNCIEAIDQGLFDKVVPSRKEIIKVNLQEDIQGLFQKLCVSYPTAFCYVMYHPAIGMWAGATPESLLKINQGILQTMALAGTQLNHGREEVIWQAKEREEQAFVTDFIIKTLDPLTSNIKTSEPYTKRAAKVMHICTDITAELTQNNLEEIVTALHPTPAVCGMPKANAHEFLLKQEGYQRKYYAGYIGELNCDVVNQSLSNVDLYVNLRCMEVEEDRVNLYIGCGVTKDSDPQAEFIETVNKSSTMKKVLM